MSTLLVASTGGHLKELHELRPRLALPEPVRWVTFDSDQSRSLLDGEPVHFVAETTPRDLRHVVTNVPAAIGLLRRHHVDTVVSTGSAVALSFLPPARALGARCHYIESAARQTAPSLSGRLLSAVPGVRLYSQWPGGLGPRWRHGGSVFDPFAGVAREPAGPDRPATAQRVVVTVGTMPFGFRRLVERVVALLGPECEVLWQTGATHVGGLGIDAVAAVPAHDLDAALAGADLVISHAGIGSALAALAAGCCPVLVPRERAHGEHVDDHQQLIARELDARGLAVACAAGELSPAHLARALARRVVRVREPPPFTLFS